MAASKESQAKKKTLKLSNRKKASKAVSTAGRRRPPANKAPPPSAGSYDSDPYGSDISAYLEERGETYQDIMDFYSMTSTPEFSRALNSYNTTKPSTSTSQQAKDPSDNTIKVESIDISDIGSDIDADIDEFDLFSNYPDVEIVNLNSKAMDEAIDALVNVSTDFKWEDNFDTFKSVLEKFSGPKPGPVKDYKTPYDVFTDIWSKNIIEGIVKETNKYAKLMIDKEKKTGKFANTWNDTKVDEIYMLFAVYMLMVLDARSDLDEYWRVSGYLQMPKFRQLMEYNRFKVLNKYLHFEDNSKIDSTQNEDAYSARLRKIAPIVNHLNTKFSNLYNLSQNITIEESLTSFKERLFWVQEASASQSGVKSYELYESKTGYLWKFDFYCGKNSANDDFATPNFDLADSSTRKVLDLLKVLEKRGHVVKMDKFYNSPVLARYLKSKGFDCLGPLQPNRRYVPTPIAGIPNEIPRGTIIACHADDVTCLAWNDSQVVSMISTYHTNKTGVIKRGENYITTPLAVQDYKIAKDQKYDITHEKIALSILEMSPTKWYMKIFKRLLNASVLNAFIMYTESLQRGKTPVSNLRDFREKLCESMVQKHFGSFPLPQISEPMYEETRLRKELNHYPVGLSGPHNKGPCIACLRLGIEKKTNMQCEICEEFLCPGNCWQMWHTLSQLPGSLQNIGLYVQKNRRRR